MVAPDYYHNYLLGHLISAQLRHPLDTRVTEGEAFFMSEVSGPSAGTGGRIEVPVDSPTGPLISTANIPIPGAWQTSTDVTAPVMDPGGTHELFFEFLNNPRDSGLFNINRIDLNGKGVAQ